MTNKYDFWKLERSDPINVNSEDIVEIYSDDGGEIIDVTVTFKNEFSLYYRIKRDKSTSALQSPCYGIIYGFEPYCIFSGIKALWRFTGWYHIWGEYDDENTIKDVIKFINNHIGDFKKVLVDYADEIKELRSRVESVIAASRYFTPLPVL